MNKSLFKFFFLIIFLFISLVACQKKKVKTVNRSFYYWKTNLTIDSTEAKILNYFSVNNLYIKYFDVKWSASIKKAIPVGTLDISYPFDLKLQNYIPCIYIANSVFEQANDLELEELARKIKTKMELIDLQVTKLMANFCVENEVKYTNGSWDSIEKLREIVNAREIKRIINSNLEIQIDCDWTQKTAKRYFNFLRNFKNNLSSKKISCTLRLWQFKNHELAGIPPVDRCLLMCYSMENPKDFDLENSIASFDQLKLYMKNSKYPLKLDIALPLYSWAKLFRAGQFKGLIGAADEKYFKDNKAFFLQQDKHAYQLKRDTVMANTYMRYGDVIKVERVDESELKKMAELLVENLEIDKNTKISFFSWDTIYIKQYDKEKINKIFDIFN